MNDEAPSLTSLREATRSRASFSGHGNSKGAAGHREVSFDPDNAEELRTPGQSIAVSPKEGFDQILLAAQWDPITVQNKGFLKKLVKPTSQKHVDLDLGCLYELHDGTRGAIQAFGEKFGQYDERPYIQLSGDERTGHTEGHDEQIHINGAHWTKVKRILVYVYIYGGATNWKAVNPKVFVDVPGEEDLVLTLGAHNDVLAVCAIGGLEQIRGGIKLTNYTEYFPGHQEMDRAFGYGLDWGDGQKS